MPTGICAAAKVIRNAAVRRPSDPAPTPIEAARSSAMTAFTVRKTWDRK
jgi:hypothetical protein